MEKNEKMYAIVAYPFFLIIKQGKGWVKEFKTRDNKNKNKIQDSEIRTSIIKQIFSLKW